MLVGRVAETSQEEVWRSRDGGRFAEATREICPNEERVVARHLGVYELVALVLAERLQRADRRAEERRPIPRGGAAFGWTSRRVGARLALYSMTTSRGR